MKNEFTKTELFLIIVLLSFFIKIFMNFDFYKNFVIITLNSDQKGINKFIYIHTSKDNVDEFRSLFLRLFRPIFLFQASGRC